MPGGMSFARNVNPRVIASRGGNFPAGVVAAATNSVRFETRTKHYIAYDTPWVQFIDAGFYIDSTNVEQLIGNDVTISRAMEIPTLSQTVGATYSGLSTGTLTNGSAQLASDKLYASSFGLAYFPAGTTFWARCTRDVSSGQNFPITFTAAPVGVTGEGNVLSNGLSANQVLGQGALTTPSGGSTTTNDILPSAIIGEANYCVAVLGIGDSIMQLGGDNVGDGSAGGSWFSRALYNVRNQRVAYANHGRSTTQASQYMANSARRSTYYPYFTHAVIHYGTNDLASGKTPAQANTAITNIANALRAADIRHITMSGVMPRTDASNVPISGFNSGGTLRDPLNALLAANAAFDEYLTLYTAVADATLADKWGSGMTSDWIHPNPTGCAAVASLFTPYASDWKPL